jgi:cytoskeletal protein CcmA (bactofilin family)
MSDSRLRRLRDHKSDSATLISEGCKISGLITGTGDFLINGEIDGDCDLSGTVTLARNGLWKGAIKAGNVQPVARSKLPKPRALLARYQAKQLP